MTQFNSYNSIRVLILVTAISSLLACNNSNSAPEDKKVSEQLPVKQVPVVSPVADSPVKAVTTTVPQAVPGIMKKTAILNNKITFLLPAIFRPMNLKEYQVKYGMPSMENNKFVYTDNQLEANFMIHLTDEPVDSSALEDLTQQLIAESKQESHYRLIKSGPVKAGNHLLQTIEFEIETLDARSVSIFYFTTVDGKLLKGNFNFPSSLKGTWYTQALQTLQSIYTN